jgi:UDP-glucose 4-epimerase
MSADRILVTGGAGFIGSHLVRALVAAGHEVHVLDDFSTGSARNLEGVGIASLHRGNLDDLAKLAPELNKTRVVIHLAALISGYDSLKAPDDYLAINVGGTLKVIDFARTAGVERILFASSSTIYSQAEYASEANLPAPKTVYASSKLTCEHLLGMYAPLVGYSHVSLRLFNVYGPRQNPNHPYANVTCKFSHAAARGLPIDLYGDGEQSRDFVYVDDVVAAFLTVLGGSRQSLYNVGTGTDVSINQMLATVESVSGVKLSKRQLPPWPNDTRRIRADVTRFNQEFGESARVPLSEGLRRTIDYFRT